MSKKKIEPTDAMVRDVECWRSFTGTADRTPLRPILRAALNHYDAPGLFADEDALRAAREEGWDQATRWIDSYQGGPNGRTSSARSANPYRPVQELPAEDGAVIIPADGHDFIEQVGDCANYRRLTYDAASGRWIGWDTLNHEAEALSQEYITPGTWRVEGE